MPRLRTVSPRTPGWTRVRCGRGFRYLDETGAKLPAEDVERITGLAIPPAWKDVWICRYPNGHLQATGVDEAGRTQYLYHPEWRRQRDEMKFDRVIEMARKLPTVRRKLDLAIEPGGVEREQVLAAAVRLIDLGCFRVGSEVYTDLYGSFGLTTLQRSHVRRNGTGFLFDYVGKSGIEQQVHIEDESVCAIVETIVRSRRTSDHPFLTYKDGRRWRPLSAADVNAYMRELFAHEVSAKDFRTWRATASVAASLAATPRGDTKTARARQVRAAMQEASELLGNTVAVVRSSYVDPRVVDLFEDGTTIRPVEHNGTRTPRQVLDRLDRSVVRLLS